MSARDVIAKAEVEFLYNCPVFVTERGADAILSALAAVGYDIVGPGEMHKATAEKCAEVADSAASEYDKLIDSGKGEHGKPGYVTDATWNYWIGKHNALSSLATAIRSLASKEDGLSSTPKQEQSNGL